jgi:CRP-like cAMP-binding protein
MYELFFKSIHSTISVTNDEEELIKEYLMPKKLRKHQYILQDGDVSKYMVFIEKGAMRSYFVDGKGVEFITQFATEGNFIGDIGSYMSGEPSIYNIDALEESELVLISKASQLELVEKLPKYDQFLHLQLQMGFVNLQSRLLDIISLNTEQRYLKLIAHCPDIVRRIPQHMIASFLGTTPETLSRIRKQITSR